MSRLRIPLFLLIGLAMGVALGLYLGWELFPTEYVDATPAYLAEGHKREYARMIASAYAVEGDLNLARERLATLGDDNIEILTAVTLDAILQQQNETDIRQLVNLAHALNINSPAMAPYLPGPSSLEPYP